MPGGMVDFDYGNNKKTAWGFTYTTRLAIYKVIPQSAIVGEYYGTAGEFIESRNIRSVFAGNQIILLFPRLVMVKQLMECGQPVLRLV